MLIMANYEWFEGFKESQFVSGDNSSRGEGYGAYKQKWAERCRDIFLHYFPKVVIIVHVCLHH